MMMSSDPSDDDVQLAAYLAGDLDELAERRLESRLLEDPELAARLDRIHDTVVALRAPDAVTLPPDLRERLGERLGDEVVPVAAPVRRPWYRPMTAVAAGIAALAVVGAGALGLSGLLGQQDAADPGIARMFSSGSDDAGPTADEDAAVEEDAPSTMAEMDADDGMEAAESPDADLLPPGGPGELIPLDQAAAIADDRWAEMEDNRASCRAAVERAVPDPAVPLGVSDGVARQRRAFVFDIATATGEAAILDTSARVVVDAQTCEVIEVEVRTGP